MALAMALLSVVAGLPPALANVSLQPVSPNKMSPAGISSPNLEWLRTVPLGVVSPAGRKVGHYFYATDWARGLVIFDVSQPETPREVGSLTLPQIGENADIATNAHVAENEDVATNGHIALISQLGDEHYAHVPEGDGHVAGDHPSEGEDQLPRVSVLNIVDVSDKANPKVIAKLDGAGDHTYECLFECKWAYGAVGGHIVDLTNPYEPRLAGNWHEGLGLAEIGPAHDVFEVREGVVLTGSFPVNLLLDVRNPVAPTVLARGEPSAEPSIHQLNWPNKGSDRFILGGNEGLAPSPSARCEVTETMNDQSPLNIGIQTWDASRWRQHKEFKYIENYLPENGMYVDGDPAVSVGGIGLNGGCTAHYFDPHPQFRNGGLVAHSTWGHGMKLLEVDADGHFNEAGFFLPHGGDTASAYWITPQIIYAIDANRGIDVLRYVGKLPG